MKRNDNGRRPGTSHFPDLGKRKSLKVDSEADFGFYLTDGTNRVLLPKKEAPEGLGVGDELTVFLYKDSRDRPIATTAEPKLWMDHPAALEVKEVNRIGAFLDWGLPKDLFLPYKEMQGRVETGDQILIRLYVDKSGRLAGSMRGIYPILKKNSPYVVGDEAEARIYEFGHDFGTFAAVNDMYSAMIPKHEDVSHLKIGDVVQVRITGVKEDGKLDISLREKAYLQINDDANRVLALLKEYAGVLPFTEKASPEVIKRETGLSKNAFKRAVGHLYKERLVDLSDGKIRLAE